MHLASRRILDFVNYIHKVSEEEEEIQRKSQKQMKKKRKNTEKRMLQSHEI